jgi:hypothetical protein
LSPNPALFALYYLAVCDDRNVPQHTGGECNVFNNEWVKRKQTNRGPRNVIARYTLFAYALPLANNCRAKKTSSSSSHTHTREFEPRRHELSSVCGFPRVSAKLSSILHCSVSLGEGTAWSWWIQNSKRQHAGLLATASHQPTPVAVCLQTRSGE